MARKKNPLALDEALESSSTPDAPKLDTPEAAPKDAKTAMERVERKKAAQVKPLEELRAGIESLMNDARAGKVDADVMDAQMTDMLTHARKAEAKSQVIDHLEHAIHECETVEQAADHLEEALHVLKD